GQQPHQVGIRHRPVEYLGRVTRQVVRCERLFFVDAHQVLAEDGRKQGLLVLEVDVDQVLVAPGGLGDAINARAGDPVGGELRQGRLQDPLFRRFRVSHGLVLSFFSFYYLTNRLARSYDDTNRLVSTAQRCNRSTDQRPARQGRRNQERGTCRRKTRPLQ